jgi:hypothetical protein
VRSFYEELIRKDGPSFPSFPWKNIWCVKAPTRLALFFWSAALGKILTHDNLHKRNVGVVCVRRMGSLLIICCFTTKSPEIFGATFLFYLG